jgi:hypothetical protein
MSRRNITLIPFIITSLLTLSACDTSSDTSSDTGRLTLGVTDAPVDGVQSVVVTFTHVTVKKTDADPQTIQLNAPQQIDLMQLAGSNALILLENEPLAVGDYQWIRLTLDEDPSQTYIIDSTGQHELGIPSGENNGLKLHSAFTIEAEGTTGYTIDFDLRKSVHKTGSPNPVYWLRPTLRIVETALAASLSGSVDPSLVTAGCSPGVYLFSEGDVVDDLDGTGDAIFSVAMPEAGPYDYSAGFLPPGNYTIAYTCEADTDEIDSDDTISFSNETPLSLAAGEDAVFDFGP